MSALFCRQHHLPLTIAALLLAAAPAFAGDRRFTYSYEVTTTPVGEVELENYITWKTDKDNDADFDRIDFKHEIEFGVTDHIEIGVYLAEWRYEDGMSVTNDGVSFRNFAVRGLFNLTSPVEDIVGIGLYGEIKLGEELFVLEGKVLLQKNIGPFILVYNGTIEAEWEHEDYRDKKAEFANSLGFSYEIIPAVSVGVELLHEIEYDDWSQWGDHVVYFGPNASYRGKGWFVTVTPLFQITDVAGEANFQVRLIFGIHF